MSGRSAGAGRRVLVIGARRVRQGIGEFVARSFAQCGAEVCGVLGTSAASAEQARSHLAHAYGIDARPYTDLARALDVERPDIVAICSPYAAHFEQLDEVAARGIDCLCEKPLGWIEGDPQGSVRRSEALAERFRAAGCRLALVTQWPETLEGYFRIYPELAGIAPRSFCMLLGPATIGPAAVLDSLPHVVSMLQALAGSGEVLGAVDARYAGRERLEIRFEYRRRAAAASVVVRCDLVTSPAPPRPAAYEIDGRRVDREIRLPAYTMHLVGEGGKRADLVDPLRLLVERFLRGEPPGNKTGREDLLVEGMRALVPIYEAVRALPE